MRSHIILAAAMLCGSFQLAHAQEQTHRLSHVVENFKDPSKSYRSAPLWVWNTVIKKADIDFQLQELKNRGFGGVFVHPRPGLITPYLGNDWFEGYNNTIKKAKELDMDVWIYDENSYPSGFAGGHVPEEMPASYNQGQMLNLETSETFPQGTDYFIVLKDAQDGKFSPASASDKTGPFYIFRKQNYGRSPWYGGYSYVDLMVKGVTEKFIEVTMKGYEQHFGSDFGKTIPGIFTDEPNIEVQGAHNIRWTPDLFSTFQSRWGYKLEDNLPSLFMEKGNWKQVRHNYYETLLQLFIDRWSKPWYEYTNAKNLEWTGHYWEHGWPNPNHGGDNMAMYAWHQRPAIDMLFNQFNEESPNAQFGNIRAVKELSSVANQIGAKRTLSETYGGGGWDLRFEDMKRLGDWEYVLGVNTLNQHLSFMTIVGARKYDYPPSFSYHSPWWPYYKNLNDYFARLSLALSSGQQINDILIIEPTTTAWMYSKFEGDNKTRDSIGRVFQHFVTKLENEQVEYDLGSENIIKDRGSIEDSKFVVGKRAYKTLILPPGVQSINKETYDLLEQFRAANGELIVLSPVLFIDGKEEKAKLAGINTKLHNGQSFSAVNLLPANAIKQVESGPVSLYHHRRVLDKGDLLFFSNSSLERGITAQIPLQSEFVYKLDLFTGKLHHYQASAAEKSAQAMQVSLAPAGSAMYIFADAAIPGVEPLKNEVLKEGAPVIGSSKVAFQQANVLPIDFCDIAFDGQNHQQKYMFEANDLLFKHFGFDAGNPWNTSVQYNDNIIKRNHFDKDVNIQVDYHFTMNPGVDQKNIKLAVERDSLWDIYVNDKVVRKTSLGYFIDKDIAQFSIGSLLQRGANKVTLKRKRMSIYAEVEPVYILGDFSVASEGGKWVINPGVPAKLGNWKDSGRPLYGFTASYTKQVNLKAGKSYKIKLRDWKGTAAVVKVNQGEYQDISYPPYETIVKASKNGKATVEVLVIGSFKNTLGPFHNKPAPGLVSPWHFRNVKNLKSSDEYETYEYGMMQDFEIVEMEP